MKKSMFLLATATLALTACTNTEDVEQGFAQTSRQIGFASHINKATRALVNNNFTQFTVFGTYTMPNNEANPIQIFNNVNVTKNGTDWTYTGQDRYWINTANYKFYAYSKENKTTGTTRLEKDELTFVNYAVDQDNQKDLVFAAATATGKTEGNNKVPFDFKHILTKIRFNFTNKFPAGYTIDISNVEIRNMRDLGTFTASSATWSNQHRSKETEIANEMLTISAPISEHKTLDPEESVLTDDIYVLPYKYNEANVRLYFTLTIKNANGEQISNAVNFGAFKPTWDKGCAYQYNIVLTGEAAGLEKIEFTTDENMDLDNGWTAGDTEDTDFNFGSQVKNASDL